MGSSRRRRVYARVESGTLNSRHLWREGQRVRWLVMGLGERMPATQKKEERMRPRERMRRSRKRTHARRETLRMPLPIFFASHPHEREWSRVRRWILVVWLRERKV